MSDTIEVQLPFSGFYESIHDAAITEAVESAFTDNETGEITDEESSFLYSIQDIPWPTIRTEYVKAYVDAVSELLEVPLEYVTMESPKFYNFSTDRIFANMPVENWKVIRAEVEAYGNWAAVIRETFTSRSGFISFFSADITDEQWTREALEPVQTRIYLEQYLAANEGEHWEYRLDILANELESIRNFPQYIDARLALIMERHAAVFHKSMDHYGEYDGQKVEVIAALPEPYMYRVQFSDGAYGSVSGNELGLTPAE